MKKYIKTGKFRTIEIKKIEFYCDICGDILNKSNPKVTYHNTITEKHACKNKSCNPFLKSKL